MKVSDVQNRLVFGFFVDFRGRVATERALLQRRVLGVPISLPLSCQIGYNKKA